MGRHFLGLSKKEKEQKLIVSAGHVVYRRTVDVVDKHGTKIPVRFRQLGNRDVAVGLPPVELSSLPGIRIGEFPVQRNDHQVSLLSRRNDQIIEKEGFLRGKLLPTVLFYQFEKGWEGDGTSGSPIVNSQQEVIAVHTGSRSRMIDNYCDGGCLGELLVSNTGQHRLIEQTRMGLNILRFFFGL